MRFGQAKYLIKQHDTRIYAVACATRLAALNCFVKMASGCDAHGGVGQRRNCTWRYSVRVHTKMLTRLITITKSLRQSGSTSRRIPLATRKELSDFLATVERRAFKQALFAVRDDQFVPYIEGDLFAVARGEHVVSRTELAAIERQELGANDFLRTGRENAEGRIQANENPRREYKGGQREGKQQEEIVAQVAPSRRLFHAGRAGLLRRPFRRNSGNESYG